jgi:hypothetical protein
MISREAQSPYPDLVVAAAAAAPATPRTFVQFYLTLQPVAKTFGTYNEARKQVR